MPALLQLCAAFVFKSTALVIAAVLGMSLSGCVTAEAVNTLVETARPPSSSDKAIIVQYVRNTWKDPYSIRDAEISDKLIGSRGEGICVWANAKNSFGAYIGRKLIAFVIRDGKVVSSTEGAYDCVTVVNKGLRMRPFPQLENIR